MRFILLNFLIFKFCFVFSQNRFQENFWQSLLVNYTISEDYRMTLDVGHRTCDNFFNANRTSLGRVVIEKKLNESWFIGAGYAFFEHFGKSRNPENRIFPQLIYRRVDPKFNLETQLRFRNEIRYYHLQNKELLNRIRFQGLLRFFQNKKFQPGLGFEYFKTLEKNGLQETRSIFQMNYDLNNYWRIQGFYIAQTQSNIDYLQHILGLQLQLNF